MCKLFQVKNSDFSPFVVFLEIYVFMYIYKVYMFLVQNFM